jgi:hypothetical protein
MGDSLEKEGLENVVSSKEKGSPSLLKTELKTELQPARSQGPRTSAQKRTSRSVELL